MVSILIAHCLDLSSGKYFHSNSCQQDFGGSIRYTRRLEKKCQSTDVSQRVSKSYYMAHNFLEGRKRRNPSARNINISER